jgi:hypothetical protein
VESVTLFIVSRRCLGLDTFAFDQHFQRHMVIAIVDCNFAGCERSIRHPRNCRQPTCIKARHSSFLLSLSPYPRVVPSAPLTTMTQIDSLYFRFLSNRILGKKSKKISTDAMTSVSLAVLPKIAYDGDFHPIPPKTISLSRLALGVHASKSIICGIITLPSP